MVSKAGKGILIIIGSFAILIIGLGFYLYSELNAHSVPPPLYEKNYPGHEERVEQAILNVYKEMGFEVSYENGRLGDRNIIELIDRKSVIAFDFWVTYCESPHNWVRDVGFCMRNQSTVALNKIYKDSVLIFNRFEDGFNFGISHYIDLFERELIENIDIEIDRFPHYEWVKRYESDSTEVSVLVREVGGDSMIIAKHKFLKGRSGFYPQIYSEKYFGDSIIRFDYDSGGHYIESKKTILSDSTIIKHY